VAGGEAHSKGERTTGLAFGEDWNRSRNGSRLTDHRLLIDRLLLFGLLLQGDMPLTSLLVIGHLLKALLLINLIKNNKIITNHRNILQKQLKDLLLIICLLLINLLRLSLFIMGNFMFPHQRGHTVGISLIAHRPRHMSEDILPRVVPGICEKNMPKDVTLYVGKVTTLL
jgi:hypothetical protein